VRQWRSLIAARQTLVGRRVAVQNRIRALFVAQGLPAPRGAKAWTETGLAGIERAERLISPAPAAEGPSNPQPACAAGVRCNASFGANT
jgi:transposase